MKNAQEKYLAIMLFQRCKFFKFYKRENEEQFWELGGEYVFGTSSNGRFERVSQNIVKDSSHWHLPNAVYYAKLDSAKIDRRRVEYKREAYILGQITKSLEKPFDNSIIIYNADTTKFLIQVAMPDEQSWMIEYYYFDFAAKRLFRWLDVPAKKIDDLEDRRLFFESDLSQQTPFVFAGFDHRRRNKKLWALFTPDHLQKIN